MPFWLPDFAIHTIRAGCNGCLCTWWRCVHPLGQKVRVEWLFCSPYISCWWGFNLKTFSTQMRNYFPCCSRRREREVILSAADDEFLNYFQCIILARGDEHQMTTNDASATEQQAWNVWKWRKRLFNFTHFLFSHSFNLFIHSNRCDKFNSNCCSLHTSINNNSEALKLTSILALPFSPILTLLLTASPLKAEYWKPNFPLSNFCMWMLSECRHFSFSSKCLSVSVISIAAAAKRESEIDSQINWENETILWEILFITSTFRS